MIEISNVSKTYETGNKAIKDVSLIQSAGGSFCIRAIKKQPFSDTDTDELFGMLCTKCLICEKTI